MLATQATGYIRVSNSAAQIQGCQPNPFTAGDRVSDSPVTISGPEILARLTGENKEIVLPTAE